MRVNAWKKLGATVLAGAALAVPATLVSTPAQAWPTRCHLSETENMFTGAPGYMNWCETGSGQHRVGVRCIRPDGSGYDVLDSWRNTGGDGSKGNSRTSVRYCGGVQDIADYGWTELKG